MELLGHCPSFYHKVCDIQNWCLLLFFESWSFTEPLVPPCRAPGFHVRSVFLLFEVNSTSGFCEILLFGTFILLEVPIFQYLCLFLGLFRTLQISAWRLELICLASSALGSHQLDDIYILKEFIYVMCMKVVLKI